MRIRGPLLVALLLSACAVATGGVASAAPATCADVLFVGARGSGQPAGGSSSDGGSGMGPQVFSSYQRLVRDLPGMTVRGVAVDYPARQVQLLALDPASYFGGLELGVRSAKGALRREVAACPNQRIVIAGFSQGAMVMHRVLQDLIARDDATARSVLRHLDGALLLADGDRLARDRTTNVGTAGASRGISYAFRPESRVRGTLLPKRFTSRVFSVCESADVICDYRSLLQSNAAGVDGVSVHTTSYTGSLDVLKATDAVAARVRAAG
jgi:cutinase